MGEGVLASVRSVVAFVAVRDRLRAAAFYRDRLGLPLLHQDDFAAVFGLGAGTLRLAAVADFNPQPFTVLGWEVSDLAAALTALDRAGIACLRYDGLDQDARGMWRTPGGDLVVWFKDPDGNVLSLTQREQ